MSQSLLAIKNRIQTVESIRKITNAMKLISSSRYLKLKSIYDSNIEYLSLTKKQMELCLFYADYSKSKLPTCMTTNDGEKTLYILVTSTLGLCGAYYHNIEKFSEKFLTKNDDVIYIDEKGYRHFKNRVGKVYDEFINLENNLSFDEVNAFRHILDSYYRKEKYKAIYIIYSRFNEKHEVKPICEKLLPLEVKENSKNPAELEPIFENSPNQVADLSVPYYLDALIYNYLLESKMCEEFSRKNSMDNASTSAKKLINELTISYNKIRQQRITQEITEIISGSGDSLELF